MTEPEKQIEELQKQLALYRAALEDVVFCCRTKISMKECARKALFAIKTDTS